MQAGVGDGYVFSVSARGITAPANGFMFAFDAPVIASVTPVSAPALLVAHAVAMVAVDSQALLNTTGGAVVILGTNFGALPNVTLAAAGALASDNRTVAVGNSTCDVLSWNNTCIVCMVGPGIAKVRASRE